MGMVVLGLDWYQAWYRSLSPISLRAGLWLTRDPELHGAAGTWEALARGMLSRGTVMSGAFSGRETPTELCLSPALGRHGVEGWREGGSASGVCPRGAPPVGSLPAGSASPASHSPLLKSE